jgi:hypothetical protein
MRVNEVECPPVEEECLAEDARQSHKNEVQVEYMCRYEKRRTISPVGDQIMVA